jgi:hypothetical protein
MRDDVEVPRFRGGARVGGQAASGDRRRPEDHLELDILEEYIPELATDDRVSRPASIARSHRELGIEGR